MTARVRAIAQLWKAWFVRRSLVSVGVVMAGEESVARGLVWTVDAPVLERPGRPPMACAMLLLSMPPQGGTIVVRGIEPRGIEDAEIYSDGTVLTPRLRLIGVLDNGVLMVTEPPSPAPDLERRRVMFPTACDDPGTGTFSRAQRQAAIAYAEAQPDLGAIWLSQNEQVLNVSFTGDLTRHGQAIRRVYPGPLCVVEAPASRLELLAARDNATNDPYLAAHHIEVISSGLGDISKGPQRADPPMGSVAHVTVAVATPEQLQHLRSRHPRVLFNSWLQPVEP